ncbi:aminoglycoside phosphotransferase (APT) family kinase protein [Crossiella equi]|uniref:Aminoglycoside phosphotransferase (APT) family kinase protein n=1 Tax=Crossiella equi TaxID=130796 RepID=A0ABS5A6T2_9PSEU|nr:aminoglycoside phosphotransferase family protein [Crossiella equi]MBP2472304.1 aminoglycoside phosphotransferase (APT) family kinase protein [Crossiella equi]
MHEVEVVVAHSERATLRVGDVFLKVDPDQSRLDTEITAMALAPVPTPEVRWHEPPVLALTAVPGITLGRLGHPSTASRTAWASAGAAIRALHESPPPPWPGRAGRSLDELVAELDRESDWLVANGVLPLDLVTRNREVAEAAVRPWTPAFTHGDLQIAHVFLDGDKVTGIIDWSEAGRGDPLYDLATFTLGQEDRLDDLLAGYGTDADRTVIHAWWSIRGLMGIRWLLEHGFDPFTPGAEVDVLRARR